MSRVLRIIAYAGLVLGLAMLVYSFFIEETEVVNGAPGASKARMIALLAGLVAVAIALGLLCAYDVTQYLGDRATHFLLFGGREIKPPPELEQAAQARKQDPLEAVRILREYLEREPGEINVMMCIAEIYESDLNNPLAAALEYEELLKQKFDPERWGWSAIHLSNLYLRLQEPDKSLEVLERIVRDYGETAAAAKAQKRLDDVRQ